MLNLLVGTVIAVACLLPSIIRFEKRKVEAEEIVLIALMAAVAAIARIPFASIPSVQPTTFIIIVTACTLGPETGLLVGAMSALISNMFLGQGPWTPWQMFAWGMIGLISGVMRKTWVMKKIIPRIIFSAICGFTFGWTMNLWMVLQYDHNISWPVLFTACISSFYFDLNHAVSNVFFITVFYNSWSRILGRIQRKYLQSMKKSKATGEAILIKIKN